MRRIIFTATVVGLALASPRATAADPLDVVGEEKDLDIAEVELGRWLFFDTELSRNHKMSCASCHYMTENSAGAMPGVQFAKNVAGNDIALNSPSIFNAVFGFRQRSNAKSPDLADVVRIPLTNHMNDPRPRKPESEDQDKAEAQTWTDVVVRLAAERDDAGNQRYAAPLTKERISRALAAYMRALAPRGSKFDDFSAGHHEGFSLAARSGYARFKSLGCASCHQGRGIGGNMVAQIGVMLDEDDRGHLGVAECVFDKDKKLEEQRFKVPSLRNVARTWPYFHNGCVNSLEEAVAFMGRAQLGRELTTEEVTDLVAFLGTLDGVPDPALLQNPWDKK